MSLVEKALGKIQPEGRAATPSVGARRAMEVEPAPLETAAVTTGEAGEHRSRRAPRNEVLDIDWAALKASGMLPPDGQERQISDQFRQIKRPLIDAVLSANAATSRAHVVLVTSALPGDGKTFTSINLAISMSLEKDIDILLVDADAAKPGLSRAFGVEHRPGLLDVIRDESIDLESLILPTSIDGLSILPIGKRGEHATELFASHRMTEIAQKLAGDDFRRVAIIDSSPLLLTSESRAMAQNAGQVVMVVRAGVTPQQSVLDALSYLGEHKSIGLVLNQSRTNSAGHYYGYGDTESIPLARSR